MSWNVLANDGSFVKSNNGSFVVWYLCRFLKIISVKIRNYIGMTILENREYINQDIVCRSYTGQVIKPEDSV